MVTDEEHLQKLVERRNAVQQRNDGDPIGQLPIIQRCIESTEQRIARTHKLTQEP